MLIQQTYTEGLVLIKPEFALINDCYILHCDNCGKLLMQMGGRHDHLSRTVIELLEKEIFCKECTQKEKNNVQEKQNSSIT